MHGVSPHPELLVTFLGSAALHALEGLLYPRSLALYMYMRVTFCVILGLFGQHGNFGSGQYSGSPRECRVACGET
jgi:hypothetical protein